MWACLVGMPDPPLWPPQACKVEELGKVDLEEEERRRRVKFFIPNWFSVEIKTGVSDNYYAPLAV